LNERRDIGQLAFVGPDGKPDWRDEAEFASGVGNGNPNLRLVFLQACETALADPRAKISGVAMRLAYKQVPAVIAMQAKVKNQVANTFAGTFYDALWHQVPIDYAVREGREAIRIMEGPSVRDKLAFGIPVVYLSSYLGLI